MPLTELPPKIKAFLPASLGETWLKAFNTALDDGRTDCVNHALSVALGEPDVKVDDDAYSFVIDLGKYKFDDTEEVTWLQAMPLGTWNHPVHGPINVTPERVQEFATNVQNGVRGQELDIDYDHKLKTTEAAGWVKAAAARSDGLWLGVQFTKSALEKVKEKAYRYFSPEFTDKWTNPATNTVHKNVLFGGALTNRPFLKGILPINLSEVITNESGESIVDVKELAKVLGLPDTATEAEVLAAAKDAKEKLAAIPDPKVEPEPPKADKDDKTEPELVNASELSALQEQVKQLREESDLLKVANRVQEVTVKLSEINASKDAKFALAPAAQDKLKSLALDAPNQQYSDALFAFVEEVTAKGIVELGERGGNGRRATGDDKTDSDRFLAAVQTKVDEDKISFVEATKAIAMAEPELYEAHRNGSYLRTKGDES